MVFGCNYYFGLVLIAGLGYIAITKLGRELMELFSGAPAYYGYVKTTIKLLSKNLTDIDFSNFGRFW